MNFRNSIYKLSFAAMVSMMAMTTNDACAQTGKNNLPVVAAQKGDKSFTLEDLNFGGNNYRNNSCAKT